MGINVASLFSNCILRTRHKMSPDWKMSFNECRDRLKGGNWQKYYFKVGIVKFDFLVPSLS